MLSRRNLFSALPILGVAAVPAAAHSIQLAPIQSEAAAFEAAVALINPKLGPLARQASADGWKPDELYLVTALRGCLPSLTFERFTEVPATKEGFEGFLVRTTESAAYQHQCEPRRRTEVTARKPKGSAV